MLVVVTQQWGTHIFVKYSLPGGCVGFDAGIVGFGGGGAVVYHHDQLLG